MLGTKNAPGTDARSEQEQPDLENPDDGQQGEPEGTPADDGQGERKPAAPAPKQPTSGKPDAAPADGKEPAAEATDTTDWKAKYEDTENKRRDTQSKLDKATNGSKEADTKLANLDQGWRGWIERNAPDAFAKLQAFEQKQGETREGERSVRSQSDSVILGVYREGDKAFGDFLTTLAESGARISSQSLDKHRETFDALRGSHAAGNGNGEAAPAPAAKPGPPRVAGAGRPSVEAPPVWDGKTFSSRKFLNEGLAAGDTRGKVPQRRPVAAR